MTSPAGQPATLERQILDLQRRLVAVPLETPVLQAQQSALTNQYQGAFERLQALQARPRPAARSTRSRRPCRSSPRPPGSPVPDEPAADGWAWPLVVGLVLGLGLALAVDRLDNRMRTREEVEHATGLAVVAEIPPLPKPQRGAHEVVTRHRTRQRPGRGLPRPACRGAARPEPARRPGRRGAAVRSTSRPGDLRRSCS